jgi:PII-like signaling protein
VFRGTEGFGATGHLHTARLLSLSEDLPVCIVIVDSAERIEAFLPQLDELVTGGLVLVEQVDVVRYVGNPAGRSSREG